MKPILILLVLMKAAVCFSQPALHVFYETAELGYRNNIIKAQAKIGNDFVNILDTNTSRITTRHINDIGKLQSLRFIVNTDTITFALEKILEENEINSNTSKNELVTMIFRELKKWDLHIDSFTHSDKEGKQIKNSQNKNYKLYALRTLNWKYYVVKA